MAADFLQLFSGAASFQLFLVLFLVLKSPLPSNYYLTLSVCS